jgi:hypothetical protein
METSRDKVSIFITSTIRGLTLARVLGAQLDNDLFEVVVWRDESDGQMAYNVVEMLHEAAQTCDFAVYIITRDDVVLQKVEDEEERHARDNCFYEAGLFMAALGRDRCFLVTSATPGELPVDLQKITCLTFAEPAVLTDSSKCANAVHPAVSKLKKSFQAKGLLLRSEILPLLPVKEIFKRERPEKSGGKLHEGYVLVCDNKPFEGKTLALHVKRNFNHGISYIYFFHAIAKNARRISSLLKIILTGGEKNLPITQEKTIILENLQNILQWNSLSIYFMKTPTTFRFRIHNASDPLRAQAYLRYDDHNFVEWQEGSSARSLWNFFQLFAGPMVPQTLFLSNKHFKLYSEAEKDFLDILKEEIRLSFPNLHEQIIQLCLQDKSAANKAEAIHPDRTGQ